MNYVAAGSATCGDSAGVAAAPRALRAPSSRNNSRRTKPLAAAKGKRIESQQNSQQNQQWETVQEIFSASRPRFVGLAYSIVRNWEDAEDAVQNAMLSAYLHFRSFEGRSKLTTWLTSIVLNAALMIRRKRKPLRIESIPDGDSREEIPWMERIPARQPDPEMICAEAEMFRHLDELLGKISPTLRQAFSMAYFEEASIEEASALLGVTAGTFKSRVFRARQHLVRRAQRSLVAPIRSATHTLFSAGSGSYAPASARSSGMF